MKRFLFSLVLSFFLSADLSAQENLLRQLLDLPAPPPVFIAADEDEKDSKPARPKEFYDDDKTPPDDAPIEDLLAYWGAKASADYSGRGKRKIASPETAKKLLEYLSENPADLDAFLNVFPNRNEEIGKLVRVIYDSAPDSEAVDEDWRKRVKNWLKFNHKFYLDELAADARQAKDHKSYGTVVKETELKALAKLDWETAKPILENLRGDAANPRAASLARRIFYERALEIKDEREIENYREELKKIVEDKNASGQSRDDALDALLQNTDWQGQDAWYLSLFADESLLKLNLRESMYTMPLNGIAAQDPDKWIPVIANLVGNENQAVHNAAVNALVQFQNESARRDALLPLLPWISNPGWAKDESMGRLRLIQSMSDIEMPESVPGLIRAVENDENYASWAANSLTKYKDARAVPALKNGLQKARREDDRISFYRALLAQKGFPAEEMLAAIEKYAEIVSTPEGFKAVEDKYYFGYDELLPLPVSFGKFLARQTNPDENLIRLVIERQKVLQKEKPAAAKIFSEILSRWQGRLVDLEMLGRIEDGKADVETIVGALARRRELRERVSDKLNLLRGKSGLAGAVAACLVEEENQLVAAAFSHDAEKRIAALACARLLRQKLPVGDVGALLDSTNKLVALAAERYLEAEDSAEARAFVLAKYPNEARILGARTSFDPAKTDAYPPLLERIFAELNPAYGNSLRPDRSAFGKIDEFQDKLRAELKINPDLLEIYSIFPAYVIRVYRDRTVFTWYETAARYREGVLKKKDFEDLKRFLADSKLEETPPVFGGCHHDCGIFEYARFDRAGGRRFFAYTGVFRFIAIWTKFQTLRESDTIKLRYYLQDKIKGLEILFANGKYKPRAVWKKGFDWRVLVSDEERAEQIREDLSRQNEIDEKNEDLDWQEKSARRFKRQANREYEHYEWRAFNNGGLGELVPEPAEIPFLRDKLTFPAIENLKENDSIWQARSGRYEIRAGGNYEAYGLWKTNRSETIKIADGWFGGNAFVSGNWAVAAKTETNWAEPNSVVRVNLRTGREYKINLPPADEFYPVAFVPAHDKILLYRAKDAGEKKKDNPSPDAPEYYLLDAASGKTARVTGEFQPLLRQTFRPLQPTGKPHQFWAAVYDRTKNETAVGFYDTKDFAFKAVLKLPDILLDSMQIWVDEAEKKVYFIYGGDFGDENHLLSVPLP